MEPPSILMRNREAWQEMARRGHRLARPVTPAELQNPLPRVDRPGWLGGDIRDWRVLCLAAGGGKHGALYTAAGARVTVVDLSSEMLDLDRKVMAETGQPYQLIEASMDDLSMLGDTQFDLVIHPVSTCYLPNLSPVFREVARVLKPQGLYISQHKQPASLQASLQPAGDHYVLQTPYRPNQPLPRETAINLVREPGTNEFLHRWEDLIGGMCRAGFVIEDLIEPEHAEPEALPGSFGHRSQYLPPYVRIKARRCRVDNVANSPRIWLGPSDRQ